MNCHCLCGMYRVEFYPLFFTEVSIGVLQLFENNNLKEKHKFSHFAHCSRCSVAEFDVKTTSRCSVSLTFLSYKARRI